MEIHTIPAFLSYYESIRGRSNKVIQTIPPDQIDWAYKENKFTIADIIRHIAATERYMYAENVLGNPSLYNGCGKTLADGYSNVLAYFNTMHEQSVSIFKTLRDADLKRTCVTPAGTEIPVWKWLRAMIEHEIHHRAQLYIYLNLLEVKTPPIFGLTEEQLAANYLK